MHVLAKIADNRKKKSEVPLWQKAFSKREVSVFVINQFG